MAPAATGLASGPASNQPGLSDNPTNPTSRSRKMPAMSNYTFHAGEATVLAADGQFTDAMPEILIGRTDGPVGQAFANMMAQSKGHTAMFAIRACNQLVKPATITVPKVTLKDYANIDLFGGVVQSATADAVLDSVIDGVIPKHLVDELCIISLVWIDPRCAKDENLSKKDMYRTNYEATRLAIQRALNNEPTIDELIANRQKIKHDMDDWS
jgi:5,6,7,8-tetrahydromethanopterin hydro-lyase